MLQAVQSGPHHQPTQYEASARTAEIRRLNDAFRQDPTIEAGTMGRVVLTSGITSMGWVACNEIFRRVREYTAFNDGNDPWGEHDFGAFDYKGQKVFWKIDYYDRECREGSPDPTNPAVTCWVLTVMLASEY